MSTTRHKSEYSVPRLERLEQRLPLAVEWGHLSSEFGDLQPPASSDGQAASLVFDVDKDGLNDFLVASWDSTESISWYRRTAAGGWDKSIIDTQTNRLEAGGDYFDVDSDGDLDAVFGDGFGDRIYWWENPYPVFDGSLWTRHLIKDSGGNKHHDMGFADVDGDGQTELVSFNNFSRKLLLFEIPTDPTTSGPWDSSVIYSWASGDQEGIAFDDINLDGTTDIVGAGRWFEHTGDGNFTAHVVDDAQSFGRAAVGQLVPGGRPEIIFSSGDNINPLQWYQWDGSVWQSNTLEAVVTRGHSLAVGDVDSDGNLDIFSGEMGQWSSGTTNNPDADINVYYGDGTGNFTKQTVLSGQGTHEGRLADLDGDGDLDILVKPFRHNIGRIDVLLNNQPRLLDHWQRHEIESDLPWRTIFVEHADIDGDGLEDAITGGWWYKNPGVLHGVWVRNTIGAPLNNMAAVYDFDDDGDIDVVGTEGIGSEGNGDLVWARNDGTGSFVVFADNVDDGPAKFLQGAEVSRFGPNGSGSLELALAWQNGAAGTQALTVPGDPTNQPWLLRTLSTTSQGEGLSAGDIDRDGDNDLLIGTQWLRNDLNQRWFDAQWEYRVSVTVDADGFDRSDKPIDLPIDFTELLSDLGVGGTMDLNSIKVIEVDAANQVLQSDVPFQFDPAADFDATTNAIGTLVVLVEGTLIAGQQRHYHVYFDQTGETFPSPTFPAQVVVMDNVIDEGQTSYRIQNSNATFFYQKQAAGFSSIVDSGGNDWVNHHPTGGSAGDFRGIPNLVFPEGKFHPGDTGSTSTIVSTGPLKATIHSETNDNQWEARWEIYPEYATMTLLKADGDYWFLYEGTPGGALESDIDSVIRSDGIETLASQAWTGDIDGDEWVSFKDPVVGRSLFVANHQDDTATDSYRPMNDEMTVFGFGRDGTSPELNSVPAKYTIGLLEETQFGPTAAAVDSAFQDIFAAVGRVEKRDPNPQPDHWTPFDLEVTTEEADRVQLADINNDGLLDAVVTFSLHNPQGRVVWYEQPAVDPTGIWLKHEVDVFDFAHSLDVADIDQDGDLDIVSGEHQTSNPELRQFWVYENKDGNGEQWTKHLVHTGDEHHDGGQLVDIDNDGDLDIISIGWINDKVVIYENLATVSTANLPPIAFDDSYNVDEDGSLVVDIHSGVLANDTDPNGNLLQAILNSPPQNGTVTLGTDGTFVYSPDANFNGVDTFSYVANDSLASSIPANVTITVQSLDDPPVSVDDYFSMDVGTTLTVNSPGVLANDIELDGENLFAIPVTKVSHGELYFLYDGSFTYTPSPGFTGQASFAYAISDGVSVSSTATVTIAIGNHPPTTANDVYGMAEDTSLAIPAPGIFSNDSDPDGDPLMPILVSDPANGTLDLFNDGSFLYTPDQDFHGIDSFTYRASDVFAISEITTVIIYVAPINDRPIAREDIYSFNGSSFVVSAETGVLANDNDVDGDTIHAVLDTDVLHGDLNLNPDGSFTYVRDAGFQGSDSFTYYATDGQSSSDIVTVNLNGSVLAHYAFEDDNADAIADDSSGNGNDGVLVNNPSFVSGQNGLALNLNGSYVDIGPLDVQGNELTLAIWFRADSFASSRDNRLISKAMGTGEQDHFWMLSTIKNGDSTRLRLRLKTNGKTDTLIADAGNIQTGQWYHAAAVYDGATMKLFLDGVEVGSQSKTGTISVDNTVSAWIGANPPSADRPFDGSLDEVRIYQRALSASEIGSLVGLTIQPVAVDDSYATNLDTTLSVTAPGVLGNDSDVDSLTANLVTDVGNGDLTLNLDGSFAYTPNVGFTGQDSFTYWVSDGVENSNTATVLIDVGLTPPDLLGHWAFDDDNGDSVASDSSGNGNDGTLVGAPSFVSGQSGLALSLIGTQHVDLGPLDVQGNELTLAIWFRADSFVSSRDNRLISKAIGTGEQDHYWMLSTIKSGSNTRLRLRLKTDGTTDTLIAGTGNIQTGQWYHAAAVYDGTTMKLFLDGVEVGSQSKTGTISVDNTVSAWIGANPPSADRPFDGLLDEVRIYQHALDAAEIASLGGLGGGLATVFQQQNSLNQKPLEDDFQSNGPVADWGAESKDVTFLQSGDRTRFVQQVVDLIPKKVGKFVASEQLEYLTPDFVLLMNADGVEQVTEQIVSHEIRTDFNEFLKVTAR